jgi:hypothetical protein
VARPSKIEQISAADRQLFFAALKVGTPMLHACRLIGISDETLSQWRKHAAEGDERYVDFIADVERHEGRYVYETMQVIDVDGKGLPPGMVTIAGGEKVVRERGDWKALAWKLEKLHPKSFAQVTKQEVTGKDGGAIVVQGEATPEAAAALLREAFGDHARKALEDAKNAEAAEAASGEKPAAKG